MAGAKRGLNVLVSTGEGQVLGGQRGATLNRDRSVLRIKK